MKVKVIEYEVTELGDCLISCKKCATVKVGSNFCQGCNRNIATDKNKRIVVCSKN